ncbi:hypothetical protein BDR06DRAFT_157076 [Suillus hirtellus]|nr:hypothetical protein BDR06DRAFT_157076 [Suillus hirtellus]
MQLPSDVDSRLCFSKHDLPRRHGALAGYIRCQRWDNIDGSYAEVCDKPQSRWMISVVSTLLLVSPRGLYMLYITSLMWHINVFEM